MHQIRLAPETVQNVVTYTVVILVENPGEKLLPGMTANVSILVDEATGVLKVPALALRFRPPTGAVAAGPGGAAAGRSGMRQAAGGEGAREGGRRGGARPDGARPGGLPGAPAGSGPAGEAPGESAWQPGKLYVLDKGTELHQLDVMTGQTDGTFVAVRGAALSEGARIVVGLEVAGQGGANSQGAVNPFTPRMPSGGRR